MKSLDVITIGVLVIVNCYFNYNFKKTAMMSGIVKQQTNMIISIAAVDSHSVSLRKNKKLIFIVKLN